MKNLDIRCSSIVETGIEAGQRMCGPSRSYRVSLDPSCQPKREKYLLATFGRCCLCQTVEGGRPSTDVKSSRPDLGTNRGVYRVSWVGFGANGTPPRED